VLALATGIANIPTNIQDEKMKLLTRLALLGAAALSQTAWADIGPFYVTYPGYCNVKAVYITPINDVYGSEVGCSSMLGQPVVGFIDPAGNTNISRYSGSSACMETYWANGQLTGMCSDGVSISYSPTSVYSVHQALRSGATAPASRPADFSVSTVKPDIDATKGLPPRP
jgi:hypothetical protein